MSLLDELDGNIEEEMPLASKKDEVLEGIVERIEEAYMRFRQSYTDFDFEITSFKDIVDGRKEILLEDTNKKAVKKELDFSITPRAIETFLQKNIIKISTLKANEIEDSIFKHFNTFVSHLIQNAYYQGHNDFHLPVLNDFNVLYGCAYAHLEGKKDDPIRLTIEGESAESHCNRDINGNIKFRNDAETCVLLSNNCDVYFYGKAINWCGKFSRNSRIYSSYKETLKEVSKNKPFFCSYFLLDAKGNAHPYGLKSKIWSLFGGKR